MRPLGYALPLATGSRLLPVFAAVEGWLKRLVQARRHRRQAAALAHCDGRMLADIGLSRADLRDAFSEPFWEDPTALLRERALERRWSRAVSREQAFMRLRTDRPARQSL
jgi:uncharacterized protein YjiS (DUF1127 family)